MDYNEKLLKAVKNYGYAMMDMIEFQHTGDMKKVTFRERLREFRHDAEEKYNIVTQIVQEGDNGQST